MKEIVFACHQGGTPFEGIAAVAEDLAWGGNFDLIIFPSNDTVARLIAEYLKDNSQSKPTNLHGIDIAHSNRIVFGLPPRDLAHHAQNDLDVTARKVMVEIEKIVLTDQTAERILVLCGSNSLLLHAFHELQTLYQRILCTAAANLPHQGMCPYDAIVAKYEGNTVRLEFVPATAVHAD